MIGVTLNPWHFRAMHVVVEAECGMVHVGLDPPRYAVEGSRL